MAQRDIFTHIPALSSLSNTSGVVCFASESPFGYIPCSLSYRPDTDLEQAQITAIFAVKLFEPAMLLGKQRRQLYPHIRQTRGDHQAPQSRRVCQVAFVDVKPAAL